MIDESVLIEQDQGFRLLITVLILYKVAIIPGELQYRNISIDNVQSEKSRRETDYLSLNLVGKIPE